MRRTEVVCEWVPAQKSDQAIHLADPVLERRSRETPPVVALQLEGRLRSVCGALFNVMRFVQLTLHQLVDQVPL